MPPEGRLLKVNQAPSASICIVGITGRARSRPALAASAASIERTPPGFRACAGWAAASAVRPRRSGGATCCGRLRRRRLEWPGRPAAGRRRRKVSKRRGPNAGVNQRAHGARRSERTTSPSEVNSSARATSRARSACLARSHDSPITSPTTADPSVPARSTPHSSKTSRIAAQTTVPGGAPDVRAQVGRRRAVGPRRVPGDVRPTLSPSRSPGTHPPPRWCPMCTAISGGHRHGGASTKPFRPIASAPDGCGGATRRGGG
jgi:hypothetical protein